MSLAFLLGVARAAEPAPENPELPPNPFGDATPSIEDAPPLGATPLDVAQELSGAELAIVGEGRVSTDKVVFVRHDGELYLGDLLLDPDDLSAKLREQLSAEPTMRVVVQADPRAPYASVMSAIQLARQAGAHRVALEAKGVDGLDEEEDPLFPGGGEVENLDAGLSKKEARKLAPKHHRFPQNPYANTNSYSAYTLEWGETKLGLGTITTGVLPGVQLGTVPLLDALGAFNVYGKANLGRSGPIDFAFLTQYYTLPVTEIVNSLDEQILLDAASAAYLAFGATASIRVASPWTLHTQLYWARPSLKASGPINELPTALFPGGLNFGDISVAGGVRGDVGVANLATDLRFNRRDSVFVWLRYPFYASARAQADFNLTATYADIDFGEIELNTNIGTEPRWLSIIDSYSLAGGYQASFKNVDLRMGIGWSHTGGSAAEGVSELAGTPVDPVNFAWVLQAFELSYKFGGPTRREERRIRKGYKDVKDLEEQGGGMAPPG